MTSHTPQSTPPPGWYLDPSDPGLHRWWSGLEWTQHAKPAPPPAHLPSPPSYNKRLYSGTADQAAGKNTAATWALTVGVVAIFISPIPGGGVALALLGSISAIIWGSIGIGRAATTAIGRGRAIAGLVLGIVNVILQAAWLLVIVS